MTPPTVDARIACDPPTGLQALLLRAVTSPPDDAVESWRRWAGETAVDDLESDSQWLLGLLFVRLRDAGVSAPAIERYANVFRRQWYASHVRMAALRPVLDELRRLGHEPVLLGGASLAVAVYPVLGARPFASLTIAAPLDLTDDQLRSAGRRLSADVGAELRWCASPPPTATREVRVAGLTLRVPGTADALVQVLAGAPHTAHGGEMSRLWWMVDAVTLGRGLDADGWAAVWRIAAEQDLTATLEARLAWLRAVGLTVEGPGAL